MSYSYRRAAPSSSVARSSVSLPSPHASATPIRTQQQQQQQQDQRQQGDTPSEAPSSHAESIHERLSVVQQEIATHRSRQSQREQVTTSQVTQALSTVRDEFHDIQERLALHSSDHRAELSLLEAFIRDTLFKIEQNITADADNQHNIFAENAKVVEEKIKELERDVFQGDGLESEEEQLGAVRVEMNTAVEAARGLCEQEEEQAQRDLAELIEPNHQRIRNLMEVMNVETRAVERVIEDTRAQLLQLAAPTQQSRLEAKEREIAQGLRDIKKGVSNLQQEREMTFATLYDAMTKLSQEMIHKIELQEHQHQRH